ncbi:transglutaminase domain-containing protein [Streptomyces sp. NPDC008139]|uniref:transglutaminase-like domain-containing protein n=1 Tax=Streptomyces sp. NPDC008139 TaxID=3364814 RepID=UPI0036EAD055
MDENEFDFYRTQSVASDPGGTDVFAGLPADPRVLAETVRNLLVHREETHLFGYELPRDRKDAEAETRYAADILAVARGLCDAPLDRPRRPEERFAGTCRDFALLLCSALREKGIPARVRGGYATYFTPGFHDDHWITEYWDADRASWRLVDAQMAAPELITAHGIDFDPFDVPRTRFVVAGRAWQDCRSGAADPRTYGVELLGLHGWWFVQHNLLLDLAMLNSTELLVWDGWGLADPPMDQPFDALGADEVALLDTVAELSAAGGPFTVIRRLPREHEALRVPPVVSSHTTYLGERTVTLRQAAALD